MFQLLWFYNVKPASPSPNFLFFRTVVATRGTHFSVSHSSFIYQSASICGAPLLQALDTAKKKDPFPALVELPLSGEDRR